MCRTLHRPPLKCVLVKLDGYSGPYRYDGCLSILPISVSFKKGGVTCSRKQFPLKIAYIIVARSFTRLDNMIC